MSRDPIPPTEVLKALGDPVRWEIIQQMAQQEELACSLLEDTLPVSKPTISYHTKVLNQAGLIEVRKRGRNYFYVLRRDVLHELMDELSKLAPGLRLMGVDAGDRSATTPAPEQMAAASGEGEPAVPLLTW